MAEVWICYIRILIPRVVFLVIVDSRLVSIKYYVIYTAQSKCMNSVFIDIKYYTIIRSHNVMRVITNEINVLIY